MSELQQKRYRSLAGWMVCLGLIAVLAGSGGAKRWVAVSPGTQVYYAVSLVVGVALLACGIYVISKRQVSRAAAWAGLAAALGLAVNQGLALWFNTILCYTPG